MAIDYEVILRIAKKYYPDIIGLYMDGRPEWKGGCYLKTAKDNPKYFFVPNGPLGTHGLNEPGYYRYDTRIGYIKEHDAPSRMDEVGGIRINGTLIINEAAANGGGR